MFHWFSGFSVLPKKLRNGGNISQISGENISNQQTTYATEHLSSKQPLGLQFQCRIFRCRQPKASLHQVLQKLSETVCGNTSGSSINTIIVSTSLIVNKKNSAMFSFKQVYLLPQESLLIIHKMIFPLFMLRPSGLTSLRVETSSSVNENQWKRLRRDDEIHFH